MSVQRDQDAVLADVSARLDRLPMSWFIYSLTILLGLAWISEAFDIGIIGSTLLPLKGLWKLTPSEVGWLGVSGTLGVVVALIPSGTLVDRFGRKKVLLGGIVWFSVFTVLGAFSQNVITLVVLRFAAGLGQGAIFPLPYAYLSEFVPPQKRGTFMGYLNGALTASYLIPPLVSSWAFQAFPQDVGWRYVFVLGAIPLILVPFLAKLLPESPRWLVKKGRIDEALMIMETIEAKVSKQIKGLLPKYTVPEIVKGQGQDASWLVAFQKPYIRRTLVVTSAYIGAFILWYTMLTFGPTLFVSEGFNFTKSLRYNVYMMFCGGVGSILMGILADKFGRKPIIATYAVLASVGCVILGYNISMATLVIAGAIVGLFGLGIFPITKIYIAEQYPTNIRGRGTFTCEAIARFFGGVLITFYVPLIVSLTGGASRVFYIVAIAMFILMTIPILTLGRETMGLSIDDASKVESR
ncbi:MAG: MFS transporter [Dehalobacterium sp.]